MSKIKLQHEHWYRCANGAVYQVIAVGTVFKRKAGIPHDSVYWYADGTPSPTLANMSVFVIVEEVIVTPAPKPESFFIGVNLYLGSKHPMIGLGHHTGNSHLYKTRDEVVTSLNGAGGSNADWVGAGIMEVTVGEFPEGVK